MKVLNVWVCARVGRCRHDNELRVWLPRISLDALFSLVICVLEALNTRLLKIIGVFFYKALYLSPSSTLRVFFNEQTLQHKNLSESYWDQTSVCSFCVTFCCKYYTGFFREEVNMLICLLLMSIFHVYLATCHTECNIILHFFSYSNLPLLIYGTLQSPGIIFHFVLLFCCKWLT